MKGVVALLLACVLVGCGDSAATEQAEAARKALAAEQYDEAKAAAERAADLGDARFEAFRYFVRGNAAYARSLYWEGEAERGDTEAAKMAYQEAEDALAFWQMAAASRADWPAARRNVERGLLRMEALRESKSERTKPESEPPPGPDQLEDPESEEPEQASAARIETADLPADQVGALLEKLIAREQKQRALRKAERKARGSQVERDW